MRKNTNLDLLELYKSTPGGKHNKLIVLNEYLQKNSSNKIDINTTVLDYAKYYQFDQIFQKDYDSRKKNSPNWETALSKWTDEIYNTFQVLKYEDLINECDGINYKIYYDITIGLDNPLHYYVDMFTKAYYITDEPYPEATNILFSVLDCFSKCLIDAVIYAHYYEKLILELKELQGPKSQNEIPPMLKEEFHETQKNAIEPIKWLKDSILLAYLFNELKNKGIIEDKHIWKKVSAMFVDKEAKRILNTSFPNYITSYSKSKSIVEKKGVPKDHQEITDIVNILIEVLEKSKK